MCKARAEEAGTGAHIDDDRVRLELCPDELNHLMREAIKLMREAIKLMREAIKLMREAIKLMREAIKLMREAIKLMREAIKLSGDPRLKQGTLTRAAAERARDLDLEPDLTFGTFRFSRRASASSAASSVWPPGRILSAFLPEMRISLSSSNEIISCTTCSIRGIFIRGIFIRSRQSAIEGHRRHSARTWHALSAHLACTQHALGRHSEVTRQTLGSHSADTRKSLGRHSEVTRQTLVAQHRARTCCSFPTEPRSVK